MRSHLPALSVSCAAAAAWFASQSATLPSTADCDASPPVPKVVPAKAPRATAVSVAEFRRWLQQRGATLDGLDIRRAADPSDPTASLAVYANDEAHRRTTRGVWGSTKRLVGLDRGEVPLATFPIASTLTASSIARLPHQGPLIAEVLEAGALDERTAVVLHLAVERARGAESLLRPWLALLPSAFATPLFWSEEELAWLKGTTLFKAAMMKKRQLEEAWRRFEPLCAQMSVQEGAPHRPSYHDFLWAHSIFWSRAIAFPGPASPDPGARVIIQEGIVPGLDFCNHARDSCCHWTVAGPGGALRPGVPPTEIRLVCPRGCALDPGLEVTIAYGEQSNEELLFNYGFAELDNPNEVLMVACPLPPPGEWDTTLQSRVALLQARGLSPQIFLPAQHLTPEERGGCRRRKGHIRYHGRRGRDRELAGPGAVQALVCDEAVQELDLPAGVMETLEVFVMEPKDVLAELDGTAQGSGAAAGRTQSAHSMGELEQSGLRLALLTTLVRLLELKVDELENPATGTGPLEDDEKMVEGGTAGEVSGHRRQALVYRLGQKKVARQYLIYANELLQQEMRHLRAISVDR